jgi:hypothetical protein
VKGRTHREDASEAGGLEQTLVEPVPVDVLLQVLSRLYNVQYSAVKKLRIVTLSWHGATENGP